MPDGVRYLTSGKFDFSSMNPLIYQSSLKLAHYPKIILKLDKSSIGLNQYLRQLEEENPYHLGLFMWMHIFIYFLLRKGYRIKDIAHTEELYGLLIQDDVRNHLNTYLKTFRSVNPMNFVKFYIKAVESFHMRPIIGRGIIESLG